MLQNLEELTSFLYKLYFKIKIKCPNSTVNFSKFEERQREYERARVIYKYALDSLPKEQQAEIFKNFSQFEKRFGSRASVEDVVWSKRRAKYEDKLTKVSFIFCFVSKMSTETSFMSMYSLIEAQMENFPIEKKGKFPI